MHSTGQVAQRREGSWGTGGACGLRDDKGGISRLGKAARREAKALPHSKHPSVVGGTKTAKSNLKQKKEAGLTVLTGSGDTAEDKLICTEKEAAPGYR